MFLFVNLVMYILKLYKYIIEKQIRICNHKIKFITPEEKLYSKFVNIVPLIARLVCVYLFGFNIMVFSTGLVVSFIRK